MKTLTNAIAILILIALIAMSAFGLYWGGNYLLGHFESLDASTRLALMAAISAIFLFGLFIIAQKRAAERRIIRGYLTDDRLKLYREILAHHHSALTGTRESRMTTPLPDEIDRELMLLGTAPVIKAHAKLTAALHDSSSPTNILEEDMAELLKAMRRDLGHDDSYEQIVIGGQRPIHQPTATGITAHSG